MAGVSGFEEAAKVSLCIDSALHCAGVAQDAGTSNLAGHQGQNGPILMEDWKLADIKDESLAQKRVWPAKECMLQVRKDWVWVLKTYGRVNERY